MRFQRAAHTFAAVFCLATLFNSMAVQAHPDEEAIVGNWVGWAEPASQFQAPFDQVRFQVTFFDDGTARFGLAASTRPMLGWACAFGDFDPDGDEDVGALVCATERVSQERLEEPYNDDISRAQLLAPSTFSRRSFSLRSSRATQIEAEMMYSSRCPFVLKSLL